MTVNQSPKKLQLPSSFKMVFGNRYYLTLAAVISVSFWIFFAVFEQLLFFSPILYFYLPEDAIPKFITSTMISMLLGIVITMNVFTFRFVKLRFSKSLFSASGLGILTGSCASCSSLGFVLASSLGGTGVAFSSFISNYEIHLQIFSIIILIYAVISLHNKLVKNCIIPNNNI